MKGYNWYESILKWNRDENATRYFNVFRQELIQTLLGPSMEQARILDVGCLDGKLSLPFARSAELLVGLDLSARLAKESAKNAQSPNSGNAFYVQGNAEALPFQSDFFDIALFLEIIEHLCDPNAPLAEIRRVLKPGGLLLVGTRKRIGGLNTIPHFLTGFIGLLMKGLIVLKARQGEFFMDLQARGIEITDPKQPPGTRAGHGHVRIYGRLGLVKVLKRNGFELTIGSGPPLFLLRMTKYFLAFPWLIGAYKRLYDPRQSFLLSRCGDHMYLLFRRVADAPKG